MTILSSVPDIVQTPRAPDPACFPSHSCGWQLYCRVGDLDRGPVGRRLLGRSLVAWRGATGKITIMEARCSHLGADLSRGSFVGDCLQCPFHHWQYGRDGRCTAIPAQADIPRFARQRTYAAAVMGPFLFVFNGSESLYPLPFFPGEDPTHFTPARPFERVLECPWFIVGSNAFDRQHFGAAHDRRLEEEPVIESPGPFARRARATFQVVGDSWQDRATRLFSGPRVTLTSTDWAGTLIFVTARFRRSMSYGMVSIRALESCKTLVQIIVWVRNRPSPLGRRLLDPIERALRRYFIRKFLESDADNLQGCDYKPHSLIAADRELAGYFTWLADASVGRPNSSP